MSAIRLTIEIRPMQDGRLRACCVDSGIRGTNLLKGHSFTNVEHAQEEIRHFYRRKFPELEIEFAWRLMDGPEQVGQ